MQTARYSAPLCLIRGRFILALGGYTALFTVTQLCEVYDTQLDHWFPMADLPLQFINSTAVVMNHRTVYLMPGDNSQGDANIGNSCQLWYLDTGSRAEFTGEKNSKAYGALIGEKQWKSLTITSADLIKTMPTAGIQLNSSQILIFGG